PPRREIADGPGDQGRAQGSAGERQRNRDLPREQRERAGIGAEPEVRGVPEGDHARVPHDEVEREGQEPEYQQRGQDRELVTRDEPGGGDQETSDEPGKRDERAPHYSSSPNSPQGRKSRTAPMTA